MARILGFSPHTFMMKKVRMLKCGYADFGGRFQAVYAGQVYELGEKEANHFISARMAELEDGTKIQNKMLGQTRKVKSNERIAKTSNGTGKRTRVTKRRKNLSKD